MSYDDVKEYLTGLKEKLKERDLQSFWVMSGNKEFRPIKNMMVAEIKEMLAEKVQYFRNKKIAEVDIWIDEKLKRKNVDFVMSIKVTICQIDEEGQIESKPYSTWGICINFMPEDLREIKFSLKLVEAIMRLAHKKKIVTDTLNGVKYKNFVKSLQKKGIEWDF
jgi:hypothetical protein